MTSLIIVGGGEHARVVAEAARAHSSWTVLGFSGANSDKEASDASGLTFVGDDSTCLEKWRDRAWFILGVGSLARRIELVRRYAGVRWASVIHTGAIVAPSASVGQGVFVAAGAIVNSAARVGDHCIVNTAAIVEHDVSLGALTHVAPGAVLGGGVTVGERAFLGLGCRIRDHVTVGEGATIAMGAVVVANAPAQATLAGVPARVRHD